MIESVKVVMVQLVEKSFRVFIKVFMSVLVIFVFQRFDFLNVLMVDFGYFDVSNLFSFVKIDVKIFVVLDSMKIDLKFLKVVRLVIKKKIIKQGCSKNVKRFYNEIQFKIKIVYLLYFRIRRRYFYCVFLFLIW